MIDIEQAAKMIIPYLDLTPQHTTIWGTQRDCYYVKKQYIEDFRVAMLMLGFVYYRGVPHVPTDMYLVSSGDQYKATSLVMTVATGGRLDLAAFRSNFKEKAHEDFEDPGLYFFYHPDATSDGSRRRLQVRYGTGDLSGAPLC